MVKLYKAAILAKKNFDRKKTKKNILKKYRLQSQININNNAQDVRVNQSFDFIKVIPNENDKNKQNNNNQNLQSVINSRRGSIMNMNNVQIIEFQNNFKNTNYQLKSPRMYKIINANNNSNESFDKYNNDKHNNLQTDANIRESTKEKHSRAIESDKIEVQKIRNRFILNGKSKLIFLFHDLILFILILFKF